MTVVGAFEFTRRIWIEAELYIYLRITLNSNPRCSNKELTRPTRRFRNLCGLIAQKLAYDQKKKNHSLLNRLEIIFNGRLSVLLSLIRMERFLDSFVVHKRRYITGW